MVTARGREWGVIRDHSAPPSTAVLVIVVIVVMVGITFQSRVRGHKTDSNNSGVEE